MSNVETNGEYVKRSYMDGALSAQFNVCSIAAADANLQVGKLFSEGKTYVEPVYIVEESPTDLATKAYVISIGKVSLHAPDVTHQDYADVFLQKRLSSENVPERPRLLAVFDEGIAVPYVGFEKRPGGQCDYVQLGSEMEDDNIVATAEEKRIDFVEAVRDQVYHRLSKDSTQLISKLIQHEIATKQGLLQEMLPASLVRYTENLFDKAADKQVADLHVLHPGSDATRELGVTFVQLFHESTIPQENMRPINLILGRPTEAKVAPSEVPERQQGLYLYALTRGQIALPLVHFNASGAVSLVTTANTLVTAEAEDLVLLRSFMKEEDIFRKSLIHRDEEYRRESEKLDHIHNHQDKSSKQRELGYIEDGFRVLVGHNRTGRRVQVLAHLDIFNRLDNLLGAHDVFVEDLLSRIGSLLERGQHEFAGIWENQTISGTISNVHTIVRVKKGPGMSRNIHVLGRPAAMTETEHQTVFNESVQLDRPSDIDPEKAEELCAVMAKICTETNLIRPAGTRLQQSEKKRRLFKRN